MTAIRSRAFDPDLHEPGSTAARGGCSHHEIAGDPAGACTGTAVVSFPEPGAEGRWRSGCATALQQLVADGVLEPLGQGA
jgi:hypothetical protein